MGLMRGSDHWDDVCLAVIGMILQDHVEVSLTALSLFTVSKMLPASQTQSRCGAPDGVESC